MWDGATKVGEAVWAGTSEFATSTITGFTVPKDGEKQLTVKMDLTSISTVATSSAGRLLTIHYSGYSSTTGIGVNSGVKLGSSSNTDFNGDVMQLMKSVPTVEKIAVPASSIPQNDAILYRLKITADAAGPIGLYKFTFSVSSSTPTATSSNFRIYGYSDDKFSVAAYQNNPVSAASVDCAGLSSSDTSCGTACATQTSTSTFATSSATTSEVAFLFNPIGYAQTLTEAISVPAGATRYFEMRGDITNQGAGTGNSMTVKFLGDTQRQSRTSTATVFLGNNSTDAGPFIGTGRFLDKGYGFLATAIQMAAGGNTDMNNFVWSPMSTSTSLTGATSTPDWANGFRVLGLPSSGLSGNNFTN